jgi:galactokinase
VVLTTESLSDAHRRKWGGSSADVKVYRAPGRVNLIGEHTDYTEGFVLPIALDLACYVSRSKNASGELRVISENNGEERRWPVSALPVVQPAGDWSDYVVGVAKELFRAGYPVEPANLRVHSTIPIGAGLSSSAAIEVGTALALLDGRAIPAIDLIQLCRRAENRFVGTPCGIMDQYVCVKAVAGTALEIDCRTLESQPVQLPADLAIIAVNSMVRHELGQSAYRDRVAECAEAREKMGVRSLRDAQWEQLDGLSGVTRQRARHVLSENQRVKQFLQATSPVAMGELFFASHASLRDDFAVSCPELDALVEMAREIPGVYGARMTGGGFGGCTVNLLTNAAVAAFEQKISEGYRSRFSLTPTFVRCIPSAGASFLPL